SVETRQTLTNVFMLNKNTGWALGHDAVIVKTNDGAKTWQKVFSDVDEQAPLLDLYFKDDVNGIVIGAYGLVYVTEDGGKTWNKNELNIAGENDNAANREAVFTDIYDIHLNDIAFAGNKRFYIAAESGHVLRSDDDAKSWTDLNLPYQGSFFGVLPLSFNKVLAYGLRGHLYLSSDAGITWEKIETGSTEMLTDGLMLADGSVLISGLAGTLLISTDEGKSFKALNLEHRHGLTSIVETKDRSILLTSDVGVELFSKEKLLSKE
ncbi:MAG: YCF48-related protein, partial [Gammaproteobacteria bacterium]